MPGSRRQREELKARTATVASAAALTPVPAPLIAQLFPAAASLTLVPEPAPAAPTLTPAQVGEQAERELAHIPRAGEALTTVQEEGLDVLHALIREGLFPDRITETLGLNIHRCVRSILTGVPR